MPASDLAPLLNEFRTALEACRDLYARAARDWAHSRVGTTPIPTESRDADRLPALMDDLHRGLLIKIYVAVAEADRQWSPAERRLAEVLLEHVWGQRLSGPKLTEAVRHVFDDSSRLRWSSVLGPFARCDVLRERVAELRTIVTRLANRVAKADGTIHPAETARLTSIEIEMDNILESVPLAVGAGGDDDDAEGGGLRHLQTAAAEVRTRYELESPPKAAEAPLPEERLAEALAELDCLVGLAPIKQEIRTLVNFLKVQAERQHAGLPCDHISLHTVFCGNPGTGKTTDERRCVNAYPLCRHAIVRWATSTRRADSRRR